MNKKMIAVAVAGAMTAPVAMADVTVYGRVQAELVSYDDGTTDERGLIDNAMGRVGVKFSEDLGNGLKAIGKMEFKADTIDGNTDKCSASTSLATPTTGSAVTSPVATTTCSASAALTGRDSFVGLKGSFGTVTFGRNAGVYKKTNLDPYIATTLEARNGGGQSSGAFGHAGFISDSIVYSNKFGAVKVGVLIRGSDADGDGDTQFAVDYKGGPLRIVAGVSTDEKAGSDDNERSKVGAQYKMGPWKFTAQVESEETGTAETDYTLLMADYKMGKNTITAKVANEEDEAGNEVDITMVALKHSFSKKTRAWVGFQNWDYDGGEEDVLTFGLRKDF